MGLFKTATITLMHGNGTIVQADLPIQLDPVNLPWTMEVQVPIDQYDVATMGWTTPVPIRSDYLVDQATGTKYSMFSTVFTAQNSLQFRVSKYSGVTP